MKKSLLIVTLAILTFAVEAQVQTPQPSPAGSVSTTVGLTDVKIDYSRPRVKGRKIFTTDASALVPTERFGEPARIMVRKYLSQMMSKLKEQQFPRATT